MWEEERDEKSKGRNKEKRERGQKPVWVNLEKTVGEESKRNGNKSGGKGNRLKRKGG